MQNILRSCGIAEHNSVQDIIAALGLTRKKHELRIMATEAGKNHAAQKGGIIFMKKITFD